MRIKVRSQVQTRVLSMKMPFLFILMKISCIPYHDFIHYLFFISCLRTTCRTCITTAGIAFRLGNSWTAVPIKPVPVCHFQRFTRENIYSTILIQVNWISGSWRIEKLRRHDSKIISRIWFIRIHGISSCATETIIISYHGHGNKHALIFEFKNFPVIFHEIIVIRMNPRIITTLITHDNVRIKIKP